MKIMLSSAAILAAAAVAPLASASSVTTYGDTLSAGFNVGSGNSSTNFAITTTQTHGTTIELGIKAKQRFIGDVPQSNGVYEVQPGFSPVSGSNPAPSSDFWWNVDFSADLGSRTTSNTVLRLTAEFSGQDGSSASAALSSSSFLNRGFFGIPFFGSTSLAQNSQNLSFGIFGSNFDPNALGTYTLTLEALINGEVVSGVTMEARNFDAAIIPLPGAAGMALAGMGLIGLRRRR